MRHFSLISNLYDFQPFCLLRKVMSETVASDGIDGIKADGMDVRWRTMVNDHYNVNTIFQAFTR